MYKKVWGKPHYIVLCFIQLFIEYTNVDFKIKLTLQIKPNIQSLITTRKQGDFIIFLKKRNISIYFLQAKSLVFVYKIIIEIGHEKKKYEASH